MNSTGPWGIGGAADRYFSIKLSRLKYPSKLMLLVDSPKDVVEHTFNMGSIASGIGYIHSGRTNVLWADSHVSPIKKEDITDFIALYDADCSHKWELIEMLDKWYGREFNDFVIITLERMDK